MNKETNKPKNNPDDLDLSEELELSFDIDMSDVDIRDPQEDGGIETQEIDTEPFESVSEQYDTPYAKEALPAEIQAYRDLMKKEHEKRDANTDGGFYFVVYCDSNAQRNDIMQQLGIDRSNLEYDSFIPMRRFIRLLDAKHGIKLIPLDGTHPEKWSFKKNSKLSDLT
jgi:hypothetical protein